MTDFSLYLEDVLKDHDDFLKAELQKMIIKKKIKGRQQLSGSVEGKYQVTGDDTAEHDLSFLDDGRFVDMGAGRMKKIENVHTNATLIEMKTRKPKKWYSRTAYGITFGRLVPKLVVHTQDLVVTQLKQAVK